MAGALVILGAGPKALAIAAKARALRDLGRQVPRIILVERKAIGSHWCGTDGYTDGHLLLCTDPTKDVGFPYMSTLGPLVDEQMFRFSWQAYLTAKSQYQNWVDRRRPRPCHRDWTDYLVWVGERCELEPVIASVYKVEPAKGLWKIFCFVQETKRTRVIKANGIVVTGHGEPYRLKPQDDGDLICDGKSFWFPDRYSSFIRLAKSKVLVIGGGETAATIVLALLNIVHRNSVRIHIMTRSGKLKERQEDPDINSLYSNPNNWLDLPTDRREEFIRNSDRGVMAPTSFRKIKEACRRGVVRIKRGDAQSAIVAGRHVAVDIGHETRYYDRVVVATGFNPLSFERLLPKNTLPLDRVHRQAERIRKVSALVGPDLSVDDVNPKLHLPMLAALRQGPGFPNLTCLGLLADRILETYIGHGPESRLRS